MAENLRETLGAGEKPSDSKRKMTQAIIEEDAKRKDVYDFLEDDDDFEEFEIQGEAEDAVMAESADKKLWQEDWDDEEADEDFARQLRAQLRK